MTRRFKIGLVLALLPPTLLTDLFRSHGIAGFLLISFVGALVTMPAPIAMVVMMIGRLRLWQASTRASKRLMPSWRARIA